MNRYICVAYLIVLCWCIWLVFNALSFGFSPLFSFSICLSVCLSYVGVSGSSLTLCHSVFLPHTWHLTKTFLFLYLSVCLSVLCWCIQSWLEFNALSFGFSPLFSFSICLSVCLMLVYLARV